MSNWPPGTTTIQLILKLFWKEQAKSPCDTDQYAQKLKYWITQTWIPNLIESQNSRVCYFVTHVKQLKASLNGPDCRQMSLSFGKGGTKLHVWGLKSENTNDISMCLFHKYEELWHHIQPLHSADYIRRFLM